MTEPTLDEPYEPSHEQAQPPAYDDLRAPEVRRIKVAHLVLGLVFLGIAGLWALDAADLTGGATARYLVPAVLVGAGVIGLIAVLVQGRRGEERW